MGLPPNPLTWIHRQIRSWQDLFKTRIWSAESLSRTGVAGWPHAILRVGTITVAGIEENRAASRAAALSFSSLIGLGPVVALAVMIGGFLLDSEDPELATNTLNQVLVFVAPQLAQLEELDEDTDIYSSAAAEEAITSTITVDPHLVSFIDTFVSSAQNGTVGAIGAITLIVIVLQLFTSIETSFNEIWGVRQGRTLVMRVAFYWSVMSLGAVLFFASITGLSATAILATFEEVLPFGAQVVSVLKLFLPLGSFLMLWGMLTTFYRAVPNTHVNWMPACVGAMLVGVALFANNYLAFLYISWVLRQKALYGSLAIPVVLMFGLYIFWLLVLLGGQVSYAIQNVRFRNSRAAWNTLSESKRERLSLTVLLAVCRRFHSCAPPPTATEIGDTLGVSNQILNECLHRLVQTNLLTPIPPPRSNPSDEQSYLPARPLGRTTLAHFKLGDDNLGANPDGFSATDPLLHLYRETNSDFLRTGIFSEPLDKLFEQHPLPDAPAAEPT